MIIWWNSLEVPHKIEGSVTQEFQYYIGSREMKGMSTREHVHDCQHYCYSPKVEITHEAVS